MRHPFRFRHLAAVASVASGAVDVQGRIHLADYEGLANPTLRYLLFGP